MRSPLPNVRVPEHTNARTLEHINIRSLGQGQNVDLGSMVPIGDTELEIDLAH
jgi:hypothetical protein